MAGMGFGPRENLYLSLRNTATGQIVLICAGALPGYCLTIFTVDSIGRKRLQIAGFGILTIIFCVLGFAWRRMTRIHLLALYVLSQFFFNFGPNATTFLTPAEIFPTRVRCTGYGFSAGMGKLGAVFAQIFFAPMISNGATHDNPNPWVHDVMRVFALFMFLGMLASFFVPESKRVRLEELAGEEDDMYELQTSSWRTRGGFGNMREVEHPEIPGAARVCGSMRSPSQDWRSDRALRDEEGEKKWWKRLCNT